MGGDAAGTTTGAGVVHQEIAVWGDHLLPLIASIAVDVKVQQVGGADRAASHHSLKISSQ